MEIVKKPAPPKGIARMLYRLPIQLFRLRLGWALGGRFLLLHHTGRVSGRRRRAVIEVIGHDRTDDCYFVCSGYGTQPDWYRNVVANPDVIIQVGRRTLPVTATPLPGDEAAEVMVNYARRHPKVAKTLLSRLMGIAVDGSEADFREAGRHVPVIGLTCRSRQ